MAILCSTPFRIQIMSRANVQTRSLQTRSPLETSIARGGWLLNSYSKAIVCLVLGTPCTRIIRAPIMSSQIHDPGHACDHDCG